MVEKNMTEMEENQAKRPLGVTLCAIGILAGIISIFIGNPIGFFSIIISVLIILYLFKVKDVFIEIEQSDA